MKIHIADYAILVSAQYLGNGVTLSIDGNNYGVDAEPNRDQSIALIKAIMAEAKISVEEIK